MTCKISFVEWGIDDAGQRVATDYTPTWYNFCCVDDNYVNSSKVLTADYNAIILDNDIVFATEEDAVRFILRWS
jgi:lipocalin